MGWKDAGFSGSLYYETPHIDQLAMDGIRFLNAYSAAPVCSPSRGAIFSGKNPARTQFTTVWDGTAGPDDRLYATSKYQGDNDQYLEARHRHALSPEQATMGKVFVDAGYRTGYFGKWHLGECPGYYPDDCGFQIAKGYRTKQVGTSKSGHWMKTFHAYGANMEGVDKDAYLADVLTDQCVDFIAANKDRPWLAVLSHYLVHTPIQAKPEKLARYTSKPKTDQINPGMAAMIESVDDSVGRLLQTIEKLGLEQNTLVIFTSDNGGLTPRNTSNYPMMGGKSFPFEGGMKVPFIMKWPGIIKPGNSSERIVGMDIYATMLGAASLSAGPSHQNLDGLNLMRLGSEGAVLEKRPIVFHFPHYTHATGPFSALVEDDWKLIRFYNDEKGAYLLYNLLNDPEEQNDLANVDKEKRDVLAKRLESLLKEMGAEMPVANPKKATGQMNLKFTKDLAEKERAIFELRLKQ